MADNEEARAAELRHWIADCEHRLHVLEHPTAPRAEFEQMWAELATLEAGGLTQALDSPTRRRGVTRKERFETVSHPYPWPDLPTVQSVAELKAFHQRVATVEPEPVYVASATMPAVSVVLTYADGVLVQAVLWGDGVSGIDVTDNIRTIASVPLRLRPPGTTTESRVTKLTRQALGPTTLTPVPPFPEELQIRAVVGIRNLDLTALDRRRVDAGEPPYILPQGAILGSLVRLDSRVTASRHLKLFATGCIEPPSGIDSEWQLLGALKSWGFAVLPVTWRCKGLPEILDFVAALQQVATEFDYQLEGGTLSVNRMGFGVGAAQDSDAMPRSVRLVFPTAGRLAKVSRIYHAVGRSGAILPVAILGKPAEQDLPIPERAPIPARDQHRLLGLELGTTIRVRPGTVAPVLVDDGALLAGQLDVCPSCGSALLLAEDEPFQRCTNPACPGRARARLLHMIGPRGLRLSSINVKIVDKLLAEVGPLEAPDLLGLSPAVLDRISAGVGARFAEEVGKIRSLPLWRALYLMAIPYVNEYAARVLSHYVLTIDRLKAFEPQDPFRIVDLPPEAALGISQWIQNQGVAQLLRIREVGIELADGRHDFPSPFLGRRVVVAGEFERGAVVIGDEVERRGGQLEARVGRTTDFVVTGEHAHREFDAAAMYNVPVIDRTGIARLLEWTSGR